MRSSSSSRRNKRVAFYLFEYRSGSLEDHDHEIEDARWMPLQEAARSLTYAGEREMINREGSTRRQQRLAALVMPEQVQVVSY